jgi:hypothetical protein
VFFDSKAVNQGAATLAVPVNNFLNSLGVDPGSVSVASTAPLFQYTGIRNYRIGVGSPTSLIALHNSTIIPGVYPGVRFNLTCEGVTISSAVSEGDALANAGALLSFEGPNEPNNFPIT